MSRISEVIAWKNRNLLWNGDIRKIITSKRNPQIKQQLLNYLKEINSDLYPYVDALCKKISKENKPHDPYASDY